ncbi:MAG: 4Fe-4S binding protein [Planctomycetota bacterium]
MRIPMWPWRRIVQIAVLASLLAMPLIARYAHYLTARQLDRVVERWDGAAQGKALEATDRAMRAGIPDGESGIPTRRPRKEVLKRTEGFYGSPWSGRYFGVDFTDLLAGLESLTAARNAAMVLFVGLLIPLVGTVLLGRVFCSWICPMGLLFELGQKLRRVLGFLEVHPGNVRLWHGNKYVLLVVGLVLGAIGGIPLLHYIYPPAILGRESHTFVMTLFDRAEAGSFGFALVGLSGAAVFLVALMLFEVAIAPRAWCASLCPGGAVYALLGRFRAVRVRRRADACTLCAKCDIACPMALHPMTDRTGMECDNCGICRDVCPEKCLKYHVSFTSAAIEPKATKPATPSVPVAAVALLVLAMGGVAQAHHILGLPHYAYDEKYPQIPVLKLIEKVGTWEIQLTGFPGRPEPGVRSNISVYIVDVATRAPYAKPVTIEVYDQPAFGSRTRIYGPVSAELFQGVFRFQPVYPADGNYEVVLSFEDGPVTSTLRFPMVVGEPGSPWTTVGLFVGGAVLFFVVVRAIRIKRARRLAEVEA